MQILQLDHDTYCIYFEHMSYDLQPFFTIHFSPNTETS